ncbi:uncharacterized protein N7469_001339 [Penicillium citrinum]|uniref:Protein kinase domain-containing protein n=1 Tax=Penicillium citrinum TaxID=5077 RepID=A0A9W9PFV0_PENCI|nr:uncharacterized protein N7469_001339 [Penicillium citrinum]KAJ5243012.1 hypothetical protein N7469_001339 [Penicillium citrinum]
MEIYGLAGTGTFGTVFVARERGQSSDPKHYAIKVEDHTTMLSGFLHNYYSPPMVMVLEESRDLRRFPNLDSVYIHDRFQAIVMSPCVDWAADLRPIPGAEPYRLFTPFTGKYLMTSDGRPLLDEMEASRVAFQILEGIVEMADLNLWHNDFSINNFIVDRHLNVTIIDLGDVKFGLEDEDFFEDRRCYLPFQEHLMSPELARVLSEQGQFEQNPEDLHDIRQVILWKFGVILFGILHGYWPWDDEREGQANLLDFGTCEKDIPRVLERRERMMSSPLVLNENLSQDCKDVLRALLDQHPEDRPNLRELTRGFPWFMQWGIVNRIWERPSSEEFYSCSFV